MEPSRPVNVLLVDDHPENLTALEATLEGIGANLIRASSGRDALTQMLTREFAVVLLDVQMAEMDGYETARLMRGTRATRHTPIIFLTALDEAQNQRLRGYAIGAVDYLFKPFEREILR